jgi:hypothetical protein
MRSHEWRKYRTSPKSQVRRKNKKKKRITWNLNFYQKTLAKNSFLSFRKGPLSLIPGNILLKSSVKTRIKFRRIELKNPTKVCLECT